MFPDYRVKTAFQHGKGVIDKKGFYNLFWGAKVTVQMRVLSAPTFFQ